MNVTNVVDIFPAEIWCHILDQVDIGWVWHLPEFYPYITIPDQDVSDIFHTACKHGNLPFAKWLHSQHNKHIKKVMKAFGWAIYCHTNLDMFQWLVDTFNITPFDIRTYNNCLEAYSIFNGRPWILPQTTLVCRTAEVGQWLVDTFHLNAEDARVNRNFALYRLATQGTLEGLKWFVDTFQISSSDVKQRVTVYDLVGFLRLPVIKYMKHTFELSTSPKDLKRALRFSASLGYLDIVQWLLENYWHMISQKYILRAFCAASKNGHLHVLQWLHQTYDWIQYEATHYFNAFGKASSEGHLHVLQWIVATFQFPREYLTAVDFVYKSPFRRAVIHEHLPVLKWLTTTFDLTQDDVLRQLDYRPLAVAYDSLDIMKWLTETFHLHAVHARVEDNWAFRRVGESGNIDGLQWLIDTFGINPIDDDAAFLQLATTGDRFARQWVRDYVQSYPHQ